MRLQQAHRPECGAASYDLTQLTPPGATLSISAESLFGRDAIDVVAEDSGSPTSPNPGEVDGDALGVESSYASAARDSVRDSCVNWRCTDSEPFPPVCWHEGT